MTKKSPIRAVLAIFIGFLHDFAAGCWAASVLAVYWLDQQNLTFDLLNAILGLKKQFFYAGLLAIFVTMATGAGRSFTYVNNVYGKIHENRRRTMLIIKHIILLVIFGIGTYWQYTMTFK